MKLSTAAKFFQFLEKKEGKIIPLEAKLFLEMHENILKNGTLESFRPLKLVRMGVGPEKLNLLLSRMKEVDSIKVQRDVVLGTESGLTEELQAEFLTKKLEIFGNYTQTGRVPYPERVNTYGDITLRDYPGFILPRNIQPGGSLRLLNCPKLSTIRENLHIPGDLELEQLPDLRYIPTGLKVEGDLFLIRRVGFLEVLTRSSWTFSEKTKIIKDRFEEKGGYVKGRIIYG